VTVFELGFALLVIGPIATILDGPIVLPTRLDALLAVTWLGLIGSGIAFLTFFRILGRWGATRTSMVAYLMPVNGVVLGALVLGEPVDARLVVGLALVISGIAVVQLRLGPARLLEAIRAARAA
jgi:drug/metabolite transporter (DMT)-like permease